jgi:TonB-dependent starch-binding outer membrane protein SusC
MCRKILQKTLVLCTVLFLSLVSYSQNKVVSGKVTDSKDGSALPGVTVTGKGTTIATQTAADGSFSVTVPATVNALVFSSIGFVDQEMSIVGKNSVNISLASTNASLGEVVVVGYGTRQKKDLTGSVSSITAKDFNKGSITTPEQLIAGKVAGVQWRCTGFGQYHSYTRRSFFKCK